MLIFNLTGTLPTTPEARPCPWVSMVGQLNINGHSWVKVWFTLCPLRSHGLALENILWAAWTWTRLGCIPNVKDLKDY